MPRQKQADPRRPYAIRLNEAERDQLGRAARRARVSVAKLARTRLLGDAPAATAAAFAGEGRQAVSGLLADQLRRVGVNLNQLLRHVHQHPDERVPAEAALILGQIRELVRQARTL